MFRQSMIALLMTEQATELLSRAPGRCDTQSNSFAVSGLCEAEYLRLMDMIIISYCLWHVMGLTDTVSQYGHDLLLLLGFAIWAFMLVPTSYTL
jgi:hypothetical protein